MTQAVVLAGGKGKRLAPILNGRPKCLVDIDGTPLLQRQLELLIANGVDDVVLLVNHEATQVATFVEENNSFGIRISLIDDGEPRGTAGAVIATLDHLADRFLVVYGDTLMNVDLRRFIASHEAAGSEATLFLHPNSHPSDSDLVEIGDDDWVCAFHPYPHNPAKAYANLVNAALYVIEKSALLPWLQFKAPSDFGKDLFPAMLAAGARLKGYNSFEYIKDVGTPKRVAEAVEQLRSGVVSRASLACPQKAVFLDRDGTLNIHRGFITRPDQLELQPDAAESVRRLNGAEFRAVLITNQPVIARGETTLDGLKEIHAKLESELGKTGAYLDRIYFCPHHPDRGYPGEISALKIVCNCRKPRTGMVEQAVRDLHIDLKQSWFVGDSPRDIETASAAGMRSILVLTGEAVAETPLKVEPNFVENSLRDAVERIFGSDGL